MGFAREVADRVVFIADGKILEEGAPADLFDHPRDPRLQDFLSKVLYPKRLPTGGGASRRSRSRRFFRPGAAGVFCRFSFG